MRELCFFRISSKTANRRKFSKASHWREAGFGASRRAILFARHCFAAGPPSSGDAGNDPILLEFAANVSLRPLPLYPALVFAAVNLSFCPLRGSCRNSLLLKRTLLRIPQWETVFRFFADLPSHQAHAAANAVPASLFVLFIQKGLPTETAGRHIPLFKPGRAALRALRCGWRGHSFIGRAAYLNRPIKPVSLLRQLKGFVL